MSKRTLKLGLVTMGAGGPGQHNRWLDPNIPADASVNIQWYVEQVRKAEAAKFDFVFIVDSQYITKDSPPHYLNRLEPLTLLSALAVATSHIGLVGTLTTSFNSPFNLARRLASLDLISGGRAGWNVVTSGDAGAAGNFGLDEHYDYETRYGRAFEYIDVVQGLWRSYEDGAFVRDRESGVFLDASKLHSLDHKGEYFSVTGPLNLQRSPQGQPVIFQAGDSDHGRNLGSLTADAIFTHSASIEEGRKFKEDISARAVAAGRDRDAVLILPGVSIYVGDSDDDARRIEEDYRRADNSFEHALAEFGRSFGWHDFRQYDLDAPFPVEALEHARRSFFTQASRIVEFAQQGSLTLRQTVEAISASRRSPFVGSAQTVADEIIRWFEGGALDGLNVMLGHPEQFDRFLNEVVPILQARGVYRNEYEDATLRGNLGLPKPSNIRTGTSATGPAEPAERTLVSS
ncbi:MULTISPECIES: LLM class flavin-dependent oxidoreductase [unclassified Novosphingobium]|uniref:LLM class flavin-dependent oxidoreductase n=1 Tax=unclassified Novosphingobium TaxID=2644732 RepID=UPI00135AF8ED|nr:MULTISPECIES: LLM class flavin-dependent oxidoreductase [unclassified Novosphingobium]